MLSNEVKAQAQAIKQKIDELPKEALAEILANVIKNCIQKQTFGQRKVADIAETLEKQLKGQKI